MGGPGLKNLRPCRL